MRAAVALTLILAAMIGQPSWADDDEMSRKETELRTVKKTTKELQVEIKELERVNAELARKMQALTDQIKEAKQNLASQQTEAEQVRARVKVSQRTELELSAELEALNEQVARLQADNAKADEFEKAELQKIELERQAELKKKAELTAQLGRMNGRPQRAAEQRRIANEKVDSIYRENARLYDQIKNRRPAMSIVGDDSAGE